MTAITSLGALRSELAATFAAIACIAERCYLPGSGKRMLGLPEGGSRSIHYRDVDVDKSAIGRMLPVWHSYAFDATVPAGYDVSTWEIVDGDLELLTDLIGLFKLDDGLFEDCLIEVGYEVVARQSTGRLGELHRRLEARLDLDKGSPLTLGQIALLADMNERSVRNAVTGDGDNRLVLGSDDMVAANEAARWLSGRRNFKPTVKRTTDSDLAERPEALLASEIPPFIHQRLRRLENTWGDFQWSEAQGPHPGWVYEAAARSGLPPERISAATELPLSIRPEECTALSELIQVDVAWFTRQVMFALYPQQMDIVVNPRNWRPVPSAPQSQEEPMKSIIVELTPAMLAHGYLDMPSEAKALFDGQDLGSKGSGFVGTNIELRYGAHKTTTDIREKSQKTIAPRKRFNSWFNSELRAKAGDRIRVDKVDERAYVLTYLPV